MELELEVNPRTIPNFVGDKRLKFHTSGQLYIYLNLEFAKNLVKFTTRVLSVMNLNYQNMVNQAPTRIQSEINKGSYYQRMIEQTIANKEEQIKNNIENYKNGKYSTPQIDLDIFFLSPKLIIHESILTSEVINKRSIDCLIIDLGQIEIKTRLAKKNPNIDYTKKLNKIDLYDQMSVKFGKLRIYADYNLRFIRDHEWINVQSLVSHEYLV